MGVEVFWFIGYEARTMEENNLVTLKKSVHYQLGSEEPRRHLLEDRIVKA